MTRLGDWWLAWAACAAAVCGVGRVRGVGALRIEAARFELAEYRAFLTNYWDVLKALDADVPDLSIQKTADERTELSFSTGSEFQYHFFPAARGGARFRVRAAHDVHLALVAEPYELDPILELFIGACNNTKSSFRLNRTRAEEVSVETPGVLRAGEWRAFRLQWGAGGVAVWRGGEPRPFLSWAPPAGAAAPRVAYLGVRTGFGASGSWVIEDLSVEQEHLDRLGGSAAASLSSVHFRVRTANDAHVGLAVSATGAPTGPFIEIVIGGWNNKKSVIRRGDPGLSDRVAVEMPDLLNASDFRGFWVRWGREVAVGREGEACPFMAWADPEPFHAAYLGVHTGFGAAGDWKIEDWPQLHTPDSTDYKYTPFVPLRALTDALDLPQW